MELNDKGEIDRITASFYNSFTSNGSAAPNIEGLHALFLADATIIKNVGAQPVIYSVTSFIEPRRELLTNGSLANFSEREVSESTRIFGNIAQRFSRYEKSWDVRGQPYRGAGAKCLHFVRTADGWKISGLIWDDE